MLPSSPLSQSCALLLNSHLLGRGKEGGQFVQRSELQAPALGAYPITLTGQFTGQLCSKD